MSFRRGLIYSSDYSNVGFGYNDSNMKTNGEYTVIKELIMPNDILFDIGANRGESEFGSIYQQYQLLTKSMHLNQFQRFLIYCKRTYQIIQ